MSYSEVVEGDWRDKSNTADKSYWGLPRLQIIKTLDTTQPHPLMKQISDKGDNGHWEESLSFPLRAPVSIDRKPSQLSQRVLLSFLGISAFIIIIVPSIVVFILQKTEDPIPRTATVNTELTIVNREYIAAFGNKDTQQYREFTTEFCQEIEKLYKNSILASKYDGCLVLDLRKGSMKVMFTSVFVSTKLPTQIDVTMTLTEKFTQLPSGERITKIGAFDVITKSVSVGQINIIIEEDNPTPRLSYGKNCRLDDACQTYMASCIDQTCKCGHNRNFDLHSDACILRSQFLRQ